MKKLIGIVAALAVFFALQACGEGDDPAPGIRLSTETLDFPAGKSTLDLVVSCPQQWRLRVSAEWCYVLGADDLNEPCEGKTFKSGVDGNNSLEGREALITLTGADGTVKTVTVTQGAAEELAPVIESFRFRTAANAAKLPQDVVLEVGGPGPGGHRPHRVLQGVRADDPGDPALHVPGQAGGRHLVRAPCLLPDKCCPAGGEAGRCAECAGALAAHPGVL